MENGSSCFLRELSNIRIVTITNNRPGINGSSKCIAFLVFHCPGMLENEVLATSANHVGCIDSLIKTINNALHELLDLVQMKAVDVRDGVCFIHPKKSRKA